MSQLLLDPERNTIIPAGSWIPSGPIPTKVREFGYFPNIDDWRPGDLLLVSAINPGWVSRQIMAAQIRGGYSEDDSRWHHVAMYIGDATLCEATGSGVHLSPIFGYVGAHRLRIRRDEELSAEQRFRLVIKALARLRKSYSRSDVLRLLFRSFRGYWSGNDGSIGFFASKAAICSQLYADAYAMATTTLITSTPTIQVTPAALSETPKLKDVVVNWKTIG